MVNQVEPSCRCGLCGVADVLRSAAWWQQQQHTHKHLDQLMRVEAGVPVSKEMYVTATSESIQACAWAPTAGHSCHWRCGHSIA